MRCGRLLGTLGKVLAVVISLHVFVACSTLVTQIANPRPAPQPITVGGGRNVITGASGYEASVSSGQEVTSVTVVPTTLSGVAGQFDVTTSFDRRSGKWQINIVIQKSGYGAILYTLKDGKKGFFLVGPPPVPGGSPFSYTAKVDPEATNRLEIAIATNPADAGTSHYFVYIPNDIYPR